MGGLSIWHWLIVAALALLLFGGRGKLSQLMGDAAKGIRAFQTGLKEGEDDHRASTASTSGQTPGTLPRTEAEQEALRQAEASATATATTPSAQSAEPRA